MTYRAISNVRDRQQIKNAMDFLESREDLKLFIKNFDNEQTGFLWSGEKEVYEIGEALSEDGHSGCSLALTLRECQRLLNLDKSSDKKDNPETEEEIKQTSQTQQRQQTPQIPQTPQITQTKQTFDSDYMDEQNKKAMNIWKTKGVDSAIKYMFTDQTTGRQLSYSEMRSLYG